MLWFKTRPFHSHPPETGAGERLFSKRHIQFGEVANSKCCHCWSATLLFLAPKGSNTINQSLMSCLVHFRRSPVASFRSVLSSVWMSQSKRLMVRPGSCPAVCLWGHSGLSELTPPGRLGVISWQHSFCVLASFKHSCPGSLFIALIPKSNNYNTLKC